MTLVGKKEDAVEQVAKGLLHFDQAATRPQPPPVPASSSSSASAFPPPQPRQLPALPSTSSAATPATWGRQPPAAPATSTISIAHLPAECQHMVRERLQDPRLSGIPRECLADPFCELKPWGGASNDLWPYCTACGCWSDSSHINGNKHSKKLSHYGFTPGGQRAIEYPASSSAGWSLTPSMPARAAVGQPVASAVPTVIKAAPSQPPRLAPERPTSDQIYDWSLQFLNFDWSTVEFPR